MKGYLIDSAARKIREVEYDDTGSRSIRAIAGFSCLAIGWEWVCGDVMYVDDEGLLKPTANWFRVKRRPDGQPYAGNGFVTGKDTADSTAAPSLRPEDILAELEWLTDRKARRWLSERASKPAAFINGAPIATWADFTPPEA